MRIVVNQADGKCYPTSQIIQAGQMLPMSEAAALAEIVADHPELASASLLTWPVPDFATARQLMAVNPDQLEAAIDGGVVTGVSIAPDPPTLWVHVTLSGNPALVTSPAGTIYLQNDGVDALTVNAQLRDGPEVATSNQVTQIGGQDITGLWALELVNVDTKALADTPLVQMTAGVISVSYTTTIAPCEVELAEDRLQPIGGYVLKLAQPVRFKIVRALS